MKYLHFAFYYKKGHLPQIQLNLSSYLSIVLEKEIHLSYNFIEKYNFIENFFLLNKEEIHRASKRVICRIFCNGYYIHN